MTQTYPLHPIGTTVELAVGEDYLRGSVIGITYTCPIYMCIVQLEDAFEGEFGEQTGVYVPESVLVAAPDVDTLTETQLEGTYVGLTEDGAIDISVVVATTPEEDGWYVLLTDHIDGVTIVRLTPFDTQEEAVEVAQIIIEENHEAAPGENAEQYLARIQAEGEDEN